MTDTLAILGGDPLRTKPFIVEPMIDDDEERLVLQAIRDRNFSRYIGIAVGEDVLTMPSAEADRLGDYWHFLGGPNVRAFAAEFAAVLDVPYAIPITSATVGLGVALAAAGVGPGDEVIVPALSFSATANAILMFNSIPVFVDVDRDTFCIDPSKIEAAITPRTRAILAVHLTGNIADMDAIMAIARKHDLVVVEDAAQAIGGSWNGRKTGTLGHAGVFSFQQSKNIMTGEGGMIVTSDPQIAKRARLILNHGELVFGDDATIDDLANVVGLNFRLPELCAALGRAQLKKLDFVNQWRTRNADVLREELQGIPGITLPPSQHLSGGVAVDIPHFFVALYDAAAAGMSRDLFVTALREEGIPIGTGYSRPMYAAPTFRKRIAYGRDGYPWNQGDSVNPTQYPAGLCPVAEDLLAEKFLWLYHIAYSSTVEDMKEVAAAIRKVMANRDALVEAEPRLANKLGVHSAGRIGVAPQHLKKG
ncbi:MAG: DegT/DnrJ/EryC1/StrS family aminotransferase [Alphaproteobacteria bacterium]|nr:DegT/DnrJ/EryC1/StrS family aminotransferase [Alphaproteobacteria bacterium]